MKCNLKELCAISDASCVIEGRLNHKRSTNGSLRDGVFKERWFRLVKNYLFYFRLSEMGKFDSRNPAGVFILENSSVQMEHGQNIPFAFSISFLDESDKRHVLAARTQEMAVQWVMRLRESSYEYLRSQLHLLQSKIFAISGYDPLLLVPRNEGSRLWAPSVPFSTASACTTSSQGFSCHLHSNGHAPPTFTLDRSHSDALLAYRNKTNFTSHCHELKVNSHASDTPNSCREVTKEEPLITFSPEEKEGDNSDKTKQNYSLEKSVTTSILESNSDKVSQVLYTRKAPSPPVRKKSPRLQRAHCENSDLAELSKVLATTSILDPCPSVPPRRKMSPRETRTVEDTEDLIKL